MVQTKIKIIIISLFILVVLLLHGYHCLEFVAPSQLNPALQVKINNGFIQGRIDMTALNGYTYFSFLGIPYARPPIGRLRFMAPKRMTSWKGVLNATHQGAHCVEVHYSQDFEGFISDGVEDCLYLNVFTPQDPQKIIEQLPVLVFIHGGAFIGGDSNITRYGPQHFMEQNIIVVTFNYRPGLLGFFSTGDLASPGNNGLKDQLAVLKWVQANIKRVGGNPKRVTIYGQSAGAASAIYQMQSPLSKGLFHGVIASSGSSLSPWAFLRNPRKIVVDVADTLGLSLDNTTEFIQQLQNVDVGILIDMTFKLSAVHIPADFPRNLPFSPTIEPEHDQAFITKYSYETLENGNFSKVPLMIGGNTMEMALFSVFTEILQPIMIIFDLSPRLLPQVDINIARTQAGKKIIAHYFGGEYMSSANKPQLLHALSDDLYIRSVHKTAQLISKYVPVYYYLFSFMSDLGLKGLDGLLGVREESVGVAHAEELFYLWKKRDFLPATKLERLVCMRMLNLWGNFVKTGNPTPTPNSLLQNVMWPPVTPSEFTYLEINDTLKVKHNYLEEDLRFWDELFKNHSTGPYTTY